MADPLAWIGATVTQGYGPTDEPLDSGYNGYANFNKGYDFGVSVGTPIGAAVSGTVVAAVPEYSDTSGWGTHVWVQDEQGNIHNYGHLSELAVSNGDYVERGQVVGYSGSTGKSTGPHLSYDVFNSSGQFIDAPPSGGYTGSDRAFLESAGIDTMPPPVVGGTTTQTQDGELIQDRTSGRWYYLTTDIYGTTTRNYVPAPTPPSQGAQPPTTYGQSVQDPYTKQWGQYDSNGRFVPYGTAPDAQAPTPVNWQVVTLPDGTVIQVNPQTGEKRPIAPGQAPGAGAAPEIRQGPDGNLYQWNGTTWVPAAGIPTKPTPQSQGAAGAQGPGGGGGLGTNAANAIARENAAAQRAFQAAQLQAQTARDRAAEEIARGNLAISQGQLDLANRSFKEAQKQNAIANQRDAEAQQLQRTALRGQLASQVAEQVSSIDPLGYSTFLDAYGGGGQGVFTNGLATGNDAVTTAALTPAALTLEALAQLNNPSGTSTGGGGLTGGGNNWPGSGGGTSTGGGAGAPTGDGAAGGGLADIRDRLGGLTGRGGGNRQQELRAITENAQRTSPNLTLQDPNNPNGLISASMGQISNMDRFSRPYTAGYITAPNGQVVPGGAGVAPLPGPPPVSQFPGLRPNETPPGQSLAPAAAPPAPGFALNEVPVGQTSTIPIAAPTPIGDFDPSVSVVGTDGNYIDRTSGAVVQPGDVRVTRLAGGGLTNAPIMMTGDAQAANPWAGGARPEIIQNPTGAPISIIPAPQTASIATGGLSGMSAQMGGGAMDAQQYRQQYHPRPEPLTMPRYAWGSGGRSRPGTNVFRAPTAAPRPNAAPAPSSGPTGPVTTQPAYPGPTTGAPQTTNTGIGGLTGIVPQQSYLDQVANYRANVQGPDLNLFDIGYDFLDPVYRDVGLMKMQGLAGIPVASQQALQRRFALQGYQGGYGGY